MSETHLIASKRFAQINSTVACSIGFTLNTFLIYMILFRSQATLRSYSRILLPCALADLLYNVFDFLCQPQVKITNGALLIVLQGPATYFSHRTQCFAMSTFLGCVAFVIFMLVFQHYLKHKLTISIGISAFLSSSATHPLSYYASLWYKEQLNGPLLVADVYSSSFIAYCAYGTVLIISAYSLVAYFAVRTLRAMRNNHQHVQSQRTNKMIEQFNMVLKIQVQTFSKHNNITIIPLFNCVIPLLIAISTLISGWDTQELAAILCIILTWVATLNPILTILCIAQYRRYVLQLIRCNTQKEYSIAVSPNSRSLNIRITS
ncbi:hypothetical protein M3Y95_00128300 [Aphelenchoides besseyi]|nr:hypothetical protein M3Y95_00128300 [Aphelenchoides besseyi]